MVAWTSFVSCGIGVSVLALKEENCVIKFWNLNGRELSAMWIKFTNTGTGVGHSHDLRMLQAEIHSTLQSLVPVRGLLRRKPEQHNAV
jgi:hypothetical protein